MEYGEKVGCKLGFGASRIWIENHEFSTVFFDQQSNEVESKSGKPVTVGNHNRELVSAQKSFQQGSKPFALEIKAGTDVLDDFRSRESGLQSMGLSFEVVSLLVGTDPAIADDSGSSP